MENYVVGFLFNVEKTKVVLIHKKRPAWQNNLWNGVGGHIETDETPSVAMAREFYEETGLRTGDYSWNNFITITYKGCIVWFFRYFVYAKVLESIASPTDEEVKSFDIDELPKVISNLHWLIPLALDKEIEKTFSYEEMP